MVLLGLLLAPVLMYFSYDVNQLKSHYPHIKKEGRNISFSFKPYPLSTWVKLKQISSFARWAIILSEDWGFYHHSGIDVEQIKVALNDMIHERKFRGASTISQQTVKNLYLSSERSVWRKIHEIILTYRMEKNLTKERILEIYLNCIEFGPGVYGIREASSHYFAKLPSSLNPKEAAFLAMLLPSPKRYYVSFKRRKITRFASARIRAILLKMRMAKILTPVQFDQAVMSRLSWE